MKSLKSEGMHDTCVDISNEFYNSVIFLSALYGIKEVVING